MGMVKASETQNRFLNHLSSFCDDHDDDGVRYDCCVQYDRVAYDDALSFDILYLIT